MVFAGFALKNIFSGSVKEPFDQKIYDYNLKPINFPLKEFPVYNQDVNDISIQYARLWKLPELYHETSESCLKTFADQHPNNLVRKQNLTALYGIEIGTENWYELTSSFEKYASEVCYSFSGQEMENVYANFVKEKLTEAEISELLKFFGTELGQKHIATSNSANDKLIEIITQKQRDASNKELELYGNKIIEIQKKIK